MPRRTPGTDSRVLRVCRPLNRHRVRYLLAGGVAANLHGSVPATRDVDLLVPKLSELPFGVAKELDVDEVAGKPITIVGDDPRVDILTVAWVVTFEQAYRTRIVRRIAGIRVPYLGLRDLLRSKKTGRARDLAEIEALSGSDGSKPRVRSKS